MAEFIRRDTGDAFDPTDTAQIAEFEGFACDVPSTDGLILAANFPDDPAATPANIRRARKLFVPELVANLDPRAGEVDLPTPDFIPAADKRFERQGLHDFGGLNVPGLGNVPVWSFENIAAPDQPGQPLQSWPAPTIRVREGDLVHSFLQTRQGPHTIHHHGIEPTPMNDGVGHLTFEVAGGGYSYQWRAAECGTYFYHCHRNTTLHFEMGMYGLLIVDPDVAGAPFDDGGAGQVRVGNGLAPYAAEAFWVADDIDTRWHGLPGNGAPIVDHVASGIQECGLVDGAPPFTRITDADNPRLHDFNPNVFVVSGVAGPFGQDAPLIATAPGSVITPQVQRGQRLLVRTLCAAYAITRWKFPTALPGTVIAADGRTLGRDPFGRYSSPFTLASVGHRFELTTARRWDVLLDIPANAATGTYEVEIAFHHWVTDILLRRVRTRIVVTS